MSRPWLLGGALLSFAAVHAAPPGHLHPLGQHAKAIAGPAEEQASTLTPAVFYDKYVAKRECVIVRGAVKLDPASSLWTDPYLMGTYGKLDVKIEKKNESDSLSGCVLKIERC